MIGFLDMDSFDVDVDIDVDMDVDVDVDGPEVGTAGSVSWLNSVLIFFNLGQIPLMIFLSFLALPMWIASVATNYFLHNDNFLISLLLLVPIFIVSLFISKILTTPFVKLFSTLTKGDVSIKSFIGKICRVNLVAKEDKKGQAELKMDGSSYLINTTTQKGVMISKGENALIIDYDENENCYLIEPYHEI